MRKRWPCRSIIHKKRFKEMGCENCPYLISFEEDPENPEYYVVLCDYGRFHYPPNEPGEFVRPFKTPPPARRCFEKWYEMRYGYH